jgi:hypothetical protein
MDIDEFCGPVSDGADGTRPYSAAVQIEQAMMSYAALEDSITPRASMRPWDIRNLQGRIRTAYYRYQATAYEETGRVLPALIRDAVLARALLAALRARLPGYAAADTLQRRFLGTRGEIITSSDVITVRLSRRAYSPVLRQADLPPATKVPWWGNRTLRYELA